MKNILKHINKQNITSDYKNTQVQRVNALLLAAVLMFSSLLFSACRLYTVVRHDKNKDAKEGVTFYFEDNSFDSNEFVEANWDSNVIPAMNERAADALDVIGAVKGNADEAGIKYGIRSAEEGSAWNFIVKGNGKIIGVNTESRAGTIDIDLLPYDNKPDFKIQIGPVIKGTAIRDSLDFIKFDDFKNQMVFAELSNAFNKRINEQILSKLDFNGMKDKEIEFMGAFTAVPSGDILVTPAKLEDAGGGK